MEAATILNDDSARILAAAGWQSDSRRLPVLRELLGEHLKRIYLYSFDESRNRAAAIDRTRRTLMRVARSIESIPPGCPLVTRVFLALEEGRVYPDENPDFWRLLVIAEEERRAGSLVDQESDARGKAGIAPDTAEPADFALANGTASHPTLRPLVSLYRRFLDTPGSEDIEPRANWPAAKDDLECFLRAQFGETGDASSCSAPAWRRWLATRPWRRPRVIIATAVTVVLAAIVLVVVFTLAPPKGKRAFLTGSARPRATGTSGVGTSAGAAVTSTSLGNGAAQRSSANELVRPGSGALAPARPTNCPVAKLQPARGLVAIGRTSVRINGARCEPIGRDSLRFAWMPAPAVTEYRLYLTTAKRDTLGIVPSIAGTCVTVPIDGVPGMVVPGSFIFRVDGLAKGQLAAVSDPQPFAVP